MRHRSLPCRAHRPIAVSWPSKPPGSCRRYWPARGRSPFPPLSLPFLRCRRNCRRPGPRRLPVTTDPRHRPPRPTPRGRRRRRLGSWPPPEGGPRRQLQVTRHRSPGPNPARSLRRRADLPPQPSNRRRPRTGDLRRARPATGGRRRRPLRVGISPSRRGGFARVVRGGIAPTATDVPPLPRCRMRPLSRTSGCPWRASSCFFPWASLPSCTR